MTLECLQAGRTNFSDNTMYYSTSYELMFLDLMNIDKQEGLKHFLLNHIIDPVLLDLSNIDKKEGQTFFWYYDRQTLDATNPRQTNP